MTVPDGNPFSFIDNMLNLLIVDDTPPERNILTHVLARATCYSLHFAGSNGKALEYLRSGKRFHACIVDLGMTDVENDEFYLLKQYGNHSSIIVLTGSNSPQKGARCITLGARAVFDKGTPFNVHNLFVTLNRVVLINIVNHRYNEWSSDSVNQATRLLFENAPESVTEWAEAMRITDRQLRNIWHTGSGFGAKHILFLYHCFNSAFDYYTSALFENEYSSESHFFRQRFVSYFTTHRELLTFILS